LFVTVKVRAVVAAADARAMREDFMMYKEWLRRGDANIE
jgi:hypothetical protein